MKMLVLIICCMLNFLIPTFYSEFKNVSKVAVTEVSAVSLKANVFCNKF